MTACPPKSFRFLLAAFAAFLLALQAGNAQAEEFIGKHPGDHPNYSVEMEPHLIGAFVTPHASGGFGLGARFTIPIVKNGFVPSINNSVGIGFGIDWAHYTGCYYYGGYVAYYGDACPGLNTIWVPVVLQWNFFLSTHWSVFGEIGPAFEYGNYSNCPGNYVDPAGHRVDYACGSSGLQFDPLVLFIGGRFHFSETASLTMRIGWPYFSIGVSFMP